MQLTHKTPGLVTLTLALGLVAVQTQAQLASPITVTPEVRTNRGALVLALAFAVPAQHHLYADELSFELGGRDTRGSLPVAEKTSDKFSGKTKDMYLRDFAATLPLSALSGDLSLAINLHGCSEEECYFPETRRWIIHPDRTITRIDDIAASPLVAGTALTSGFEVARRASGYLNKEAFLRFLNPAEATTGGGGGAFAGFGVAATVGLILVGGLALNFTPCVLPMIPINLAILGAGARSENKRRGFALGVAYGGGMALAYGGLGLAVVLTGSKFGTLNSSPWFNFAIAAVFCVMGLAMFDKFAIDFSRFQRVGPRKSNRGAFLGATMMGSFSALLAGACVAPVVISVLLLATTSYQHGNMSGLLFPFVLGLGMALPWPFAAGGLTFLPKPGLWMTRVKYAFGVIIFGFAVWYGHLGYNLAGVGQAQVASARSQGVESLRAALEESRQTGKPVLVDFWASWCKNCAAMEHTTFRDSAVRERLGDYVVVKFQAERLNDDVVKPVLDEFGVLGLPAYVVLQPQGASTTPATAKTLARN